MAIHRTEFELDQGEFPLVSLNQSTGTATVRFMEGGHTAVKITLRHPSGRAKMSARTLSVLLQGTADELLELAGD